jgi:hypothetical protein
MVEQKVCTRCKRGIVKYPFTTSLCEDCRKYLGLDING